MAKAEKKGKGSVAKKSTVTDPLAIPEFLKVANRGKKVELPEDLKKDIPPPNTQAFDQKAQEDAALAALSPEDRALIEEQIEGGMLLRRWLLDKGTIQMALILLKEKQQKKDAKKAVFNEFKEKERAERAARPKAPDFGHSTTFKVVQAAPRKAGTRGAAVYAAMAEWSKANPDGTVAQLLAAAPGGYNKTDYKWDEERGHIKSNIALFDPKPASEAKPKSDKPAAAPKTPRAPPAPPLPPPTEAVWSSKTKKKPEVKIPAKDGKGDARKSATKAVREFGKKNIKKDAKPKKK